MKRREFIAGVAGAPFVWPLRVSAQTPAPVVAFLNGGAPATQGHYLEAFRRGLAEAGFLEGRTVVVEPHWANGENEALPAMAVALVRRQVTVIVAGGPTATRAAKAATSTIPIVFSSGEDPVRAGFVDSLARPGGNVTGITFIAGDLAAKRVELARELVPHADLLAILATRTSEGAIQVQNSREAVERAGKRLLVLEAASPAEIDAAFESAKRHEAGIMLLAADPFFGSQRPRIVALATLHAVPLIAWDRIYTANGGLASYGASNLDVYRLVGVHTARILKGEKPADLPVQQPTKFEMLINLNTAKALGLNIPPLVLARADEVVE